VVDSPIRGSNCCRRPYIYLYWESDGTAGVVSRHTKVNLLLLLLLLLLANDALMPKYVNHVPLLSEGKPKKRIERTWPDVD
jgi:hypothetical protein